EEMFAAAVAEARRKGLSVTDETPPRNVDYMVNGLRLHVLDWGGADKPAMVLIHGALVNAHSWDFFSMEMRERFHIYSVDLPGHGDSEWAADGDYSRARMSGDLLGLFQQLDLTSPVLLGHSLGGSLATLVAPQIDVKALVLVDSTLLPNPQPNAM